MSTYTVSWLNLSIIAILLSGHTWSHLVTLKIKFALTIVMVKSKYSYFVNFDNNVQRCLENNNKNNSTHPMSVVAAGKKHPMQIMEWNGLVHEKWRPRFRPQTASEDRSDLIQSPILGDVQQLLFYATF